MTNDVYPFEPPVTVPEGGGTVMFGIDGDRGLARFYDADGVLFAERVIEIRLPAVVFDRPPVELRAGDTVTDVRMP